MSNRNAVPPDTGCEESPTCLSCPLPQCKYDDPAAYHRLLKHRSDLKVRAALEDGLSLEEAASQFHVTVRTIFRILARTKKDGKRD